jgi:integrase
MDLKATLREKKPDVSDSTINTYYRLLSSFYKKVYTEHTKMLMANFNDYPVMKDYLNTMPPTTQKNYWSALYVLTGNPLYKKELEETSLIQKAEISKQVKSAAQEENWIEPEEIATLMATLKKEVALLYKKENKTMDDIQYIQQYILLCLLGGQFIDTRRSKDFYDFKIRNIDKETDNFLKKEGKSWYMVFNSYKTAKSSGQQVVEVPKSLMTILRKWIKINPTDYLLFDVKGQPLTAITVNQRFKKIFGRNASVNLLRHTHLTDKFGDSHKEAKAVIQDLKNTMTNMGSSLNMAETYIKN